MPDMKRFLAALFMSGAIIGQVERDGTLYQIEVEPKPSPYQIELRIDAGNCLRLILLSRVTSTTSRWRP